MKHREETGLNPHQLLKLVLTVNEINDDSFSAGVGLALCEMYRVNIELPPINPKPFNNISKVEK